MNFQPFDRLPQVEWAEWWDKTLARWHQEGLSEKLNGLELLKHFGLDPYVHHWVTPRKESFTPPEHYGQGVVRSIDEYQSIKEHLFPPPEKHIRALRSFCEAQAQNKMLVWFTMEGFFWFPRTLLGIEQHLYAFYDDPELMHQMNHDNLKYQLSVLEGIATLPTRPVFMTFAEDMSYNHGPMLSKTCFDEFLAPYYHKVVPALKELNIIPIVDSDGRVDEMIPWLEEVGIEAILPLERQAGVDASELRRTYPRLRMIGHFDKMTMVKGERVMREEFERLLPVMKAGGFIPGVDHQTPPNVPLKHYYCYLRLLKEYTRKAVNMDYKAA